MTPNTKLEERFDAEFNFFKDITITPRQAGDFDRANLLQTYYRRIGDDIKAFIKAELAQERAQVVKECMAALNHMSASITNAYGDEYIDRVAALEALQKIAQGV